MGASIAGLSKGFSRAIGENTSVFSQHAAKNSGFRVLTSVNYSNFQINGVKVFEKVDDFYTTSVNQANPFKKYSHAADKCNLVEASLSEVYLSAIKNLNIKQI